MRVFPLAGLRYPQCLASIVNIQLSNNANAILTAPSKWQKDVSEPNRGSRSVTFKTFQLDSFHFFPLANGYGVAVQLGSVEAVKWT